MAGRFVCLMPIELLLAASGLLAGAFGALLGLGGGILIVPILTLGFAVSLPTAIGTSLICVIATSTGSTAYALSCGGPIIHPALEAVVIAPISPHTLSDRPIVLGRDSSIEIRLVERSGARAQVTCDGVQLGGLEPGARLSIGPSSAAIALLHPQGHDYFRLLRSKLHWGRSGRSGSEEY